MQAARVLLVEDQATDIAVAVRAFGRHGLRDELTVVEGGEEALDLLLSASPRKPTDGLEVILLDLRMPRIDGRAVLRALRADERTRSIPIVVVSSSDDASDVQDCYQLGANSYVVKRFDPLHPGEYLVEAARYWLEHNEVAR